MDARLVADLVHAQFPELAPARVTLLGDGTDSWAFEVNGEWVFRFPKRPEVERRMAAETRILFLLCVSVPLPVPIPWVSYHGLPTPRYPLHFAGYAKLPGVPAISLDPGGLPLPELAPALGRFLALLHSFPVGSAARCGVPESPLGDEIAEWREEALADFPHVAGVAPEEAARWRAYLERGVDAPRAGRRVLVHNDLAAEHVLYDAATGTLAGVIDWTDVAVSDPAADFAGVLHWGGPPLLERVLASYGDPVDEASLACARYLAACRGVADVAFGLERGRSEYVAAGVRALRMCAGEA